MKRKNLWKVKEKETPMPNLNQFEPSTLRNTDSNHFLLLRALSRKLLRWEETLLISSSE